MRTATALLAASRAVSAFRRMRREKTRRRNGGGGSRGGRSASKTSPTQLCGAILDDKNPVHDALWQGWRQAGFDTAGTVPPPRWRAGGADGLGLRDLVRAVMADQFIAPIWQRIGRASRARDWPRAARLYRSALRRVPNAPAVWVQYGHALKKRATSQAPKSPTGEPSRSLRTSPNGISSSARCCCDRVGPRRRAPRCCAAAARSGGTAAEKAGAGGARQSRGSRRCLLAGADRRRRTLLMPNSPDAPPPRGGGLICSAVLGQRQDAADARPVAAAARPRSARRRRQGRTRLHRSDLPQSGERPRLPQSRYLGDARGYVTGVGQFT